MPKNAVNAGKAKQSRKRGARIAGTISVVLAIGSAMAGGTALALSGKRTKKLARKLRRVVPEPTSALSIASAYLPEVVDRLADRNGHSLAGSGSSKTSKKSKKRKAKHKA